MTIRSPFVPLASVVRERRDESVHFGAFVVLDADGVVVEKAGDPAAWIFPRSAWKPVQAAAMVDAGLELDARHLAVVCASHSGTEMHLALVNAILDAAGIDERALANTPQMPLGVQLGLAPVCDDRALTSLHANCSGKHAGMLATCVRNGWPWREGVYLSRRHLLQRRIEELGQRIGADAVAAAGSDGCGAPTVVCTLQALAESFRVIGLSARPSERAVREAMIGHPDVVAGPGRVATDLMLAVPGAMAKDGAEGVFAAAMPDGRALAIKIADGSTRPWRPLLAALLNLMGIDCPAFPVDDVTTVRVPRWTTSASRRASRDSHQDQATSRMPVRR
jgi:L-asparaginase II